MKPTPSLFKRLLLAAALATVLLATVTAYDAFASRRVLTAHPAPGQVLDLGDTEIHAICRGHAEPTLVLFHGYGGGAIDWLPLMDELAPNHRVCALDRPGNDYSPPVATDANGILRVLHSAIEQLHIEKPFVVGHSLGGAFALRYAAEYPVAGLILVDGLSPDVADQVTQRLGSYVSLAPLAKLGLLRPLAGSFVHASYSTDLYGQMLSLRSRGSAIAAMAAEGAIARSELGTAALRRAEADLRSPLLVLAAGATDVPEGEAFAQSLQAFASRTTNSAAVIIPDAGHYLINTHAHEIAAQIDAWLTNPATTANAVHP